MFRGQEDITSLPRVGESAGGGGEQLSAIPALDHNGPRHDVVHSPVVLEEQEGDEDREEEGDGEVLVECPHCRAVKDQR